MAKDNGIVKDSVFEKYLESRGVDRRSFLKWCTAVTATLALPPAFARKVAAAVAADNRPSVLWLHFQECTGDSEALLRASAPTMAEIVLDYLSVDYHETIMAAAGHQAEEARHATMEKYKGEYLAVVEGAIPTKDGASTAASAATPRWRSPRRCAATRRRRSAWGPAPPSGASRRLTRTPPAP